MMPRDLAGTGEAMIKWRKGVAALAFGAVALSHSVDQAAAQARGVIIQIPDDVAPGSARPKPAPPPAAAPPATAPSTAAPSTGTSAPPAGTATSACQGAACTAPDAWHVLNTSNRTCLVLSKNALKGGKDVRKLSTLLPAPLFVVAAGACP